MNFCAVYKFARFINKQMINFKQFRDLEVNRNTNSQF